MSDSVGAGSGAAYDDAALCSDGWAAGEGIVCVYVAASGLSDGGAGTMGWGYGIF